MSGQIATRGRASVRCVTRRALESDGSAYRASDVIGVMGWTWSNGGVMQYGVANLSVAAFVQLSISETTGSENAALPRHLRRKTNPVVASSGLIGSQDRTEDADGHAAANGRPLLVVSLPSKARRSTS